MKTRHSMGIVPFLLIIGALPARATQVYYTIDFSLNSGGPSPASGSFYYDSSTSTFASFDVAWDSFGFDFTSSANSFAFTSPTDPCYAGATTGPQEVFLFMTGCSTGNNPAYYSSAPSWLGCYTEYYCYTFPYFNLESAALDGSNEIALVTITGSPSPLFGPEASGGFDASAPEPGTSGLVLIGLCAAMRKRIASGFREVARTLSTTDV